MLGKSFTLAGLVMAKLFHADENEQSSIVVVGGRRRGRRQNILYWCWTSVEAWAVVWLVGWIGTKGAWEKSLPFHWGNQQSGPSKFRWTLVVFLWWSLGVTNWYVVSVDRISSLYAAEISFSSTWCFVAIPCSCICFRARCWAVQIGSFQVKQSIQRVQSVDTS